MTHTMPTLIQKPSPNFSRRSMAVDAIVLHADASPSVKQSIAWIQNPVSQVSYHALCGRLGDWYQFVAFGNRAWHSGKSKFGNRPNCNDYSIGISFSNRMDGEAYTDAQYRAGAQLVRWLMTQYPAITTDRITRHSIVSPGRKFDPGPKWDQAYFLSLVRG